MIREELSSLIGDTNIIAGVILYNCTQELIFTVQQFIISQFFELARWESIINLAPQVGVNH